MGSIRIQINFYQECRGSESGKKMRILADPDINRSRFFSTGTELCLRIPRRYVFASGGYRYITHKQQ
jgi:hypothetical protein